MLCWLLLHTCLAQMCIRAQQSSNLDIKILLSQVQSKHRENASKLIGYTYILKRTDRELNDKGDVKLEESKVFQVFLTPHGAAIYVLLSENGKELSPELLAEEKAKANREWQKQKKEVEKKSRQAEPQLALLIFETAEFSYLRNESYKGRDVVILRFEPRAGSKSSTDSERFVSKLEGEVWIDVAEQALLKLDARLAKGVRFGGLPGFSSALKPGTTLMMENEPIRDGLWVATKVEFASSTTGIVFSQGRRGSQKQEMSGHRPFDKEADHLY